MSKQDHLQPHFHSKARHLSTQNCKMVFFLQNKIINVRGLEENNRRVSDAQHKINEKREAT